MTYRCPLGNLQPSRIDTEEVKRDGWRQHGILVVSAEDSRIGWMDKELIVSIGNRLYGERNGK
jgi:hypothetical protein